MQPEVTGRSVPNKYRLQTTLTSINYRLPWDTAYANFIQTTYIAENSAYVHSATTSMYNLAESSIQVVNTANNTTWQVIMQSAFCRLNQKSPNQAKRQAYNQEGEHLKMNLTGKGCVLDCTWEILA